MMKTLCQRRFAKYASYGVADSELERRYGSRIRRDQHGQAIMSTRPKIRTVSSRKFQEFQDGYSVGVETLGDDGVKMINEEAHLRAEVGDNPRGSRNGKGASGLLSNGSGWNQETKETMIDKQANPLGTPTQRKDLT